MSMREGSELCGGMGSKSEKAAMRIAVDMIKREIKEVKAAIGRVKKEGGAEEDIAILALQERLVGLVNAKGILLYSMLVTTSDRSPLIKGVTTRESEAGKRLLEGARRIIDEHESREREGVWGKLKVKMWRN